MSLRRRWVLSSALFVLGIAGGLLLADYGHDRIGLLFAAYTCWISGKVERA